MQATLASNSLPHSPKALGEILCMNVKRHKGDCRNFLEKFRRVNAPVLPPPLSPAIPSHKSSPFALAIKAYEEIAGDYCEFPPPPLFHISPSPFSPQYILMYQILICPSGRELIVSLAPLAHIFIIFIIPIAT